MRGGEACAPIWRWRRGLLAVSGMSPTPRELRRVYPGVYPGLETEGHASLMRSSLLLGPARAPFFGTFGAVFSPVSYLNLAHFCRDKGTESWWTIEALCPCALAHTLSIPLVESTP